MNVAIYLRLSMSDGDLDEQNKKESNSIENQRMLLQDFILQNPDLYGDVIEYVDDGYSGTNFNRPAFQQMITDAKNGLIQVVLVKDLSRLGRNYIEMGDYLDQIFPRLGVRVIAVGSNYDSNEHLGDVSGMDAAITNFINAMYSRDLSVRRKTSYKAMLKNGTITFPFLPYGYCKDPNKKNGWLIDEESAEVIRFIFRKASRGCGIMQIVNILNEEQVKKPGEKMEELYNINVRHVVTEEEYLWNSTMVREILQNYCYTGAAVAHQTESSLYDFKKVKYIPREEWVIIENHHVPIVDKETFEKAQSVIRRVAWRDRGKPAVFALKKKLRCGNCHLAFHYRKDNKLFYCNHKNEAGMYSRCNPRKYSYPRIESAVLKALKRHLSDLKHLDAIARNAIEMIVPTIEEKKKNQSSRIEILKAERVRQYEGYAQGLITKEVYLEKKKKMTDEIDRLEAEMKELNTQRQKDETLLSEIQSANDESGHVFNSPKLTKYIVEHFIENVYVHDYDRIEIVYKTEDLFERTIQRCNEILEVLSKSAGEGSHHYNSEYVKRLRENNLFEKYGKKGSC